MTTIGTHLSRSLANVDAQRRMLADATAGTPDASEVVKRAQSLAHAEGHHYVMSRAADLIEGGQSPQVIALAVLDTIAVGPDDQWSGRGNDVARARFDGMLDAAKAMRYDVLVGAA